MKDLREKFIHILKIEFKDLRDDIDLLIEHEEELKTQGKISNYVYHENLGFFRNELFGVNDVFAALDDVSVHKYADVASLYTAIKEMAEKVVKDHALFKAGYIIMARRIDKVYRYVTEEE